MAAMNISLHPRWFRSLPASLVNLGYGFLYWLAFLLVLEPDNVLRAHAAGHSVDVGHEALRMVVAASLGASTTPAVLMLTRRFPLLGPGRLRHALVHSAGTAGLALGLIVASCFLAAWGYDGSWLPSIADLHEQIVGNGLLLIYALLALTAIAHVMHRFRRAEDVPGPSYETRVPVKTRGRQGFVELSDVDWIETQGNYLALHVGPVVHLIRESSVAFEARLDPACFVRIHRRSIVAIDRIRQLQPVTNGDALLYLADGQSLRVSRGYRRDIAQRWTDDIRAGRS
jgi:LytTr DNA-binding domain